jgi:hypothetical protein
MISTVQKKYNDVEWTSYKMTMTNGKIYYVPLDEANTDYQAIQEWIAEGNSVIDNPPE